MDYVKGTIHIVSYTDDIMDKPFGVNEISQYYYIAERIGVAVKKSERK